MKITLSTATLALALLAAPLHAQQKIPLDTATINRLGVVFAPVATPENSNGQRFAATVIASPLAASDLFALHGGILEGWQVQSGQQVKAGQLLGSLRSPEMAALQQQWGEAEAQATLSSKALERDRQLEQQGIISRQRLQQTEREAQAAQFQLKSLTAQLEQGGYGESERKALGTSSNAAGRYLIKAPAAGTVTHLRHVTGDQLSAGETLLSIASEQLWITAEVPARIANRLSAGQSLNAAEHNAGLTLRQLDKAVDPATQTVGLLAEFTGKTGLLPGQVISITVPADAAGALVPAEAVVRIGNDRVVFVRNKDGVETRTLQLQSAGTDYLAREGIKSGEQVVVRGAALIKGIMLGLGGE